MDLQNNQSIKNVKVRAYIRFSKPSFRKDDDGKILTAASEKTFITSKIQNMKDTILKYCIEKKLAESDDDIIFYVDDGISGKKDVRARKMQFIIDESKEGDSVVIFELSRIGRKMTNVARTIDELLNKKIKIYCIHPNIEITDNIVSSIYVMAFGIAAELEREMNINRTKNALEAKKRKGIQLGRKKGALNNSTICSKYDEPIKKFLLEGRKQKVIASILGIKYTTLNTYIKKNNLKPSNEKVEIDGKIELREG